MTETAKRKKKKRGLKLRIGLAVVVLAAVGAGVYFKFFRTPPVEKFATTRVLKGSVIDKLAETGSIQLVRTVEVKSTIAGEVRQLPVEAGEVVTEGQVLAIIEPDPTQSLQLYQKRSAVDQARIQLKEQEQDVARRKSLYERNMLSAEEYEKNANALTQIRNQLRLAELEVEVLEAKANLSPQQKQNTLRTDEVKIVAPIGGVVIRRGVEIGEVVASGLSSFTGGTTMFEIGDPSQMIIKSEISEVDVGRLQVGQPVDIVADAFPDTTYHGRVRWVAPVGEKKAGSTLITFETEIEFLDHEPRLRQGMSCDVDIVFARHDSTAYLPTEAVLEVFPEDQEQAQEKVKGQRGRLVAYLTPSAPADSAAAGPAKAVTDSLTLDQFTEVDLTIGLETSTRTEVLNGLQAGDRVAANAKQIRDKKTGKALPPGPPSTGGGD
ncbi:MAG: efflux RND transporter periplasmic adaptor subunit [Candidatus Latescibacteria bacterium]|nr:efflux RND transporter periplasmic adaptor subunit [Candidatus Latescibacterota bacterium]